MTSLLRTHLDQISLCATSIGDLTFSKPKIFTNALLSNHDITALIRDTEQHERALFHLAPPPLPKSAGTAGSVSAAVFADSVHAAAAASATTRGRARRATTYAGVARQQPRNKAVAAVLGGDLYLKTRKGDDGTKGKGNGNGKGEVDVEVLLLGAEKLGAVYPIPGATEKITALRRRQQQLTANIAHYEARVAEQTRELQAMNRPASRGGLMEDAREGANGDEDEDATIPMTKEDLRREEEEIRELERKKRGLEERVMGMERDLGGLMR